MKERLGVLTGRDTTYWMDPRAAGHGTITSEQREEIRREGEALAVCMPEALRQGILEDIRKQSKRWGPS